MTGIGLYPDQYRSVPALLLLQGGSKLKRMRRYYPVIVICSSNQSCRIFNTSLGHVQENTYTDSQTFPLNLQKSRSHRPSLLLR